MDKFKWANFDRNSANIDQMMLIMMMMTMKNDNNDNNDDEDDGGKVAITMCADHQGRG